MVKDTVAIGLILMSKAERERGWLQRRTQPPCQLVSPCVSDHLETNTAANSRGIQGGLKAKVGIKKAGETICNSTTMPLLTKDVKTHTLSKAEGVRPSLQPVI